MAAGVTNAAPIGDGLKVIASGTITEGTATLPSPALVLIFQIDYSSITLGGTVLQSESTWVSAGDTNAAEVSLSATGVIAFQKYGSSTHNLRYLALG